MTFSKSKPSTWSDLFQLVRRMRDDALHINPNPVRSETLDKVLKTSFVESHPGDIIEPSCLKVFMDRVYAERDKTDAPIARLTLMEVADIAERLSRENMLLSLVDAKPIVLSTLAPAT